MEDSILTFETSDLWVAGYLKASQMHLQSTQRRNGKVYFIFENLNQCQRLVDEYFSGAAIPASELKHSINLLKDLIFNKS